MVIIDENLPASLVSQLHKWGIRARVVGVDVAHVGIKDENLIPVLHSLKRVTFFTLDKDFYTYQLCHRSYCLVQLELSPKIAADYIRQFLKHPAFDTETKRLGKVVRLHRSGLEYFEIGKRTASSVQWPE